MPHRSPAAVLAYQKAHYHENRGPELLAGCIISIFFVAIGISFRFWAHLTTGKGFAADSWLILTAAVIAIATTACVIIAVANGLGKHEVLFLARCRRHKGDADTRQAACRDKRPSPSRENSSHL